MRSIKKAIAEILGHDLQLVPSNEWFSVLEKHAEDVTTGGTWSDIVRIVLYIVEL